MIKQMKINDDAPATTMVQSAEENLAAAHRALSAANIAQNLNEQAIEAAQARVSEYTWGVPDDDRGKLHEREAKEKLTALANNRGPLNAQVKSARLNAERFEARLMLIRSAGASVEALQAAEAEHTSAARLLDQAAARRDEAAAALATAQNRRQQCVAAAARGEASAAKNLKAASADRDDAADVLEAADLVLEEAQRRVNDCENAICDGLAKGLAVAASNIGEERAAVSARMGVLVTELVQCLAVYETKGVEARKFVMAARSVPHRDHELSRNLDAVVSRNGPDVRLFARFLLARMPNEVRYEIAHGDASPGSLINDLESIERTIWSALRVA